MLFHKSYFRHRGSHYILEWRYTVEDNSNAILKHFDFKKHRVRIFRTNDGYDYSNSILYNTHHLNEHAFTSHYSIHHALTEKNRNALPHSTQTSFNTFTRSTRQKQWLPTNEGNNVHKAIIYFTVHV